MNSYYLSPSYSCKFRERAATTNTEHSSSSFRQHKPDGVLKTSSSAHTGGIPMKVIDGVELDAERQAEPELAVDR
jgi:hypothetical protein